MNHACPICEENKDQSYYKKVNNYSSNICKKCGHIYVNNLNKLSQNRINDYYSIDFYENYMNDGYEIAYQKYLKQDFVRKISLLDKFLSVGSSILEVGSGPGYFASLLANKGYKVTPVELTKGAREYAKKYNKYDEIFQYNLENKNNPIYGKEFDGVISWATIEHVKHPLKFVNLLKSYTKKNGLIFIDTGVTNFFTRNIDSGYSKWLEPPWHLHVFSCNSIINVFKKNDFNIEFFDKKWNVNGLSFFKRFLRIIKIVLNFPNKIFNKNKPGVFGIIGLVIAKKK